MSRVRLKVAALCGNAELRTPGLPGPPLCENKEVIVDENCMSKQPVCYIDLGPVKSPVREVFAQCHSRLMTGTALIELATLLFGGRAKAVLAEVLKCEPGFIARFEVPGTMAPPPLAIAILKVCSEISMLDHIALLDENNQTSEIDDCFSELQRAFSDIYPFSEKDEDYATYSLFGNRLVYKIIEWARWQRYDIAQFKMMFARLAGMV